MSIHNGRALAAQYRRKFWVRHLWRSYLEPVVGVLAVGLLAVGYVLFQGAWRFVAPFIAGMAFTLWLVGAFIH
jgi:hypothetical protein